MPAIVFHNAAIQKLCTGALAHLHAKLTQSKQIPLADPFLRMGAQVAAETHLPESRLLLLLRSVIEEGHHHITHGAHPTKVASGIEEEIRAFLEGFTPAANLITETVQLDYTNLSPSPCTLQKPQIILASRPSIQDVILFLRKAGSILLVVDAISEMALSTIILNRFYTKEPICVVKKGNLMPPVQTASKAHVEKMETTLSLPGHQEKTVALKTLLPFNFITPHTIALFKTPIAHSILTRSLTTILNTARALFLSPVLISKK